MKIEHRLAAWQTAKLAAVSSAALYLRIAYPERWFIACFGVCLFVSKFISTIIDYLLLLTFGYERLGRMDELMLSIYQLNQQEVNAQAMMTTTRFDFKQMQDFLLKSTKKV